MTAIPFCGQSYSDKTLNANAQEAINWYPMRTQSPQASNVKTTQAIPEKIVMYPTPGYKFAQSCASYATSTQTPIRGFYVINNILYTICGNTLLSFTPTGSGNDLLSGIFTPLGTLNTVTGLCSIVCNTVQLAISDGQYGYTYNLSTNTFATIGSSGAFPAAGGVTNFTFFDGYVVAAKNTSKTVIQSNLLDATTWQTQSFDTITSFPDNIIAVFSDELQLYVFGPKITEVQSDAGTIPYAFQKVAGVLIQAGVAALQSIAKVGNTVVWLASDSQGRAYVAALQGYGTKVLSTPPINEAFERYPIVSDAYAYAYREGDSLFYMITFPTAGVTWGYDVKMDMWHKRSINNGTDLPVAYTFWQGNHVVGDLNGTLYLMSQNYSTYSNSTGTLDTPLTRIRTTSHLNNDGQTMFLNELWVDMQQGFGFVADPLLNPQPTGEPLATLEVSKDYAYTWHTVGVRSMGSVGKYLQRVLWRNLGRFRQNITFRLTVTDPVGAYIIGARAKITPGSK